MSLGGPRRRGRSTVALIACGLLVLAVGCGSGPSALATRAHEDARIAERMVDSRPGAAARRFVEAGAAIDALAARHRGHPLTEELQRGDRVGDMPRARFEARLAAARRAMGDADLLAAAVDLLPPPRQGLARLQRPTHERPVDRLRAALIAAGRPIPPGVEAHGPPAAPPSIGRAALPAPMPADARAFEQQWPTLRGHPDADVWLVAAFDRLPMGQRFVRARELHRGRPWQALAERLLADGDREGAARALGFAVERGLLEGLAAPLRADGWLPVQLDRTLRAAGQTAEADRLLTLYAAGLARAFAVPGNGIDDLEAKAEALGARALEVGDPVAAGWLSRVVRRDLLDDMRRRARRPGRDPAVVAAWRRVAGMGPVERAEPALADVRAMAPALAAAAMAHGGRAERPGSAAAEGLSPRDRMVFHLASARLDADGADAHIGAALDAAAEAPDVESRIDALVDAHAVRVAVKRAPGPRLRAGLARLLFAGQRRGAYQSFSRRVPR